MVSRVRSRAASRYRHVDRVEVSVWGRFVGAVALDPQLGFYVFAYDPAFRKSGIDLAPLSMPISDPREVFVYTELAPETYKRLPPLLADALPDDFGNALVNRYMAQHGISAQDVSSLDRLAYMADRAMGALEFAPRRGPATRQPTAIVLSHLVDAARDALRGRFVSDDDAGLALRNIIDVGTSAGGARAKAVIAWNRESGEIRSGQLRSPPGFEQWLLKFDGIGADHELGVSQDYGRIEYAYFLMAREAGIEISECRLLHENGRSHFMTRRFDRGADDARHHMQTLCAMSHLDYKLKGTNAYAQLFLTVRDLGLGYEALQETFRRMAFNVVARNCDDHTKNFSFLLRRGEGWRLAPAYDITFAHNPNGAWTHQHLMSVNGKFKDFSSDDLYAEAERFGVGSAPAVLRQVQAAVDAWPSFAREAGVSPGMIESIASQHLKLA